MMPADQMANPLQDTALTPTELLMREAIQNSVDEKREDVDGPVRYVVRRLNLRGEEKRSLVDGLRLTEFRDRAMDYPDAHGWFRIDETCLSELDDPDASLPLVVLSDHLSRLQGEIPKVDVNPHRPTVNIVDLFSGCGGLAMGVKWACEAVGLRPVIKACVEIESYPLEVYKSNLRPLLPIRENCANLVDYERLSRGISELSDNPTPRIIHDKIGNLSGDVDLLIAGPPCEGNSNFNNKTRRIDRRNEFYVDVAASAIALQAKAVIIENVTMVTHSRQKVVERAIEMLRTAGYKIGCNEVVLEAASFGTPQRRRRHFLIASYKHEFDASQAFAEIGCPEISVMEAIEDLIGIHSSSVFDQSGKLSPENESRTRYLIENNLYDLPDTERPECHRDGGHSYKSVYGRMYPDQPASTLTKGFLSPGRGRFTHPIEARGLSPHEGARLQGFPDDFTFLGRRSKGIGKQALSHLIGDAVPPQLGYAVGLAALSLL